MIMVIITHLECPARGDDVSSVIDVISSASQDMALQLLEDKIRNLLYGT